MKGDQPKPIETPNLDHVLAFPGTCDYGRVELAVRELAALKREVSTYCQELECCASTFGAMTGSGPAHAQRIRRVLKLGELTRSANPAKVGGEHPSTDGEPR